MGIHVDELADIHQTYTYRKNTITMSQAEQKSDSLSDHILL